MLFNNVVFMARVSVVELHEGAALSTWEDGIRTPDDVQECCNGIGGTIKFYDNDGEGIVLMNALYRFQSILLFSFDMRFF